MFIPFRTLTFFISVISFNSHIRPHFPKTTSATTTSQIIIMKSLISLATVALLSNIALAAPLTPVYPNVPVTFNGAAGTGYSMVVVANAVAVPTNNDLSITSISMEGRASFICKFYGIDGSETFLVASQV
jgi:hypothetical protein